MSDIFYSQVDTKVQAELNARAAAGIGNKTTDDLNFMLGKTANVRLNAYDVLPGKNAELAPIPQSQLGGTTTRRGEYLPDGNQGYLTDRPYTYTEQAIQNGTIIKTDNSGIRKNTSKRIPPYITSADINIGDHSMGLLNSATINIVIPNPNRDLDFIESVYMRPGRHVQLFFESSISSIITRSANKTGNLSNPNIQTTTTESENKPTGQLHTVTMNGMVKSFSITYQTNLTVEVTLNIIGTSNTYPDLRLILDSSSPIEDRLSVNSSITQTTTLPPTISRPVTQPAGVRQYLPAAMNNSQPNTTVTTRQTLFQGLNTEIENIRKTKIAADSKLLKLGYAIKPATEKNDPNIYAVVWGEPYKGVGDQVYITLNWIINFINVNILQKMKQNSTDPTPNPNAKIYFNDKITKSNLFINLVSADPLVAFFPGRLFRTYNENNVWYNDLDFDTLKFLETTNEGDSVTRPSRIFINTTTLQNIITELEKNETYKISDLLQELSKICSDISGGAIDLQLVTHPDNIDDLMWYDAKKVISKTNVVPYNIPMGGEYGTAVRDFKFTGQLPNNAASLAYVLNLDPSQIAESDVAPFVSYMYTANNVSRTATSETVGAIVSQEDLDKIKQNYKNAHNKFLTEYTAAKKEFIDNVTTPEKQAALAEATRKHIQYPTDDIIKTNEIAAPVIPFDTEFTIDGLNGFRYGDVLTFNLLPSRYRYNVVFSIINISHTISTDGIWTTTIRCITRPKLGQ